MRRRLLALLLLPVLGLGLALPDAAVARGGRYAGPAGPPPAPDAEEPAAPAGPDHADAQACGPTPEDLPRVEAPSTAEAPALGGGAAGLARGRRSGVRTIGITDWLHWYEVNRERFEDLRAGRLLTSANPIFGVGDAAGPSIGRPVPRVSDRTREQILHALARVRDPEATHWIHTEAAALIAVGKIAHRAADVGVLFDVLRDGRGHSAYLRETAVLALGHLRRTDPGRQLEAALLDRSRDLLVKVLADDDEPPRTRAFAAVSLGMLGDQPGSRADGVDRWTAEHLFRTFVENGIADEVQVGLLLGLARQRPAAVTPVMRLVLEGCAVRGREWPDPRSMPVRSHALLALARLGDARSAQPIASLLEHRSSEHSQLDQAAAMAAAILGERIPEARPVLAAALARTLRTRSEPGSLNLTLVALGRLIAAESIAGEEHVLAKGGALLLENVREAPPSLRAFAALALALAIRPVDAGLESEAHQTFRRDGILALRDGLADGKGLGPHERAAFATALGLARDGASGSRLLEMLADLDETPELRAYAGLALGLMGDGRDGVLEALGRAVRDPRSELLRMRAATAIGLVGSTQDDEDRERRLAELVAALRATRSQVLKGQIAITLARLGDARAVTPLLEVLEGDGEAQLNRAVACAGLGLLGDGEVHPTLSETRQSCHYLAGSVVVHELLDLL